MNTLFDLKNGELTLSRSLFGEQLEIRSYEEYKQAMFALKREGTPLTAQPPGVLYDRDDLLEGKLLHQRLEELGPRRFIRVGSCQHIARADAK